MRPRPKASPAAIPWPFRSQRACTILCELFFLRLTASILFQAGAPGGREGAPSIPAATTRERSIPRNAPDTRELSPPRLPPSAADERPSPPTLAPTVLERSPPTTTKRHLVLPLPTVKTEPLVGFMLGLRVTYAYRPEPTEPNRVYLALNSRVSLSKVHEHGVQLNLHDFLHRGEVFSLGFSVRLDPRFPYYGQDQRLRLDDRSLEDPTFLIRANTYGGYFNFQHVLWRHRPSDPKRVPGALRALLGLTYNLDAIDAGAATLLAQEAPEELGRTRRGTLRGGIVWDRRDNEWSPRWGGLHSATAEIGGPWSLSSTGTWARLNLTARWYRPIISRDFVLANQIVIDSLLGDVPFIPLGQMGVINPIDAFGGRDIGRGYVRRRHVGRFKAVYSLELRFEPVELNIRGHLLGVGFKLFTDIGRVVQPEERRGSKLLITGGPGVYIAVDRFSIIRLDAGFSPETFGLFVTGEHTF